jgi:hypothetical protein
MIIRKSLSRFGALPKDQNDCFHASAFFRRIKPTVFALRRFAERRNQLFLRFGVLPKDEINCFYTSAFCRSIKSFFYTVNKETYSMSIK